MFYTETDVCDRECMDANDCHGFRKCPGCGHMFCPLNFDDWGVCPDCADCRETLRRREEDGK